MLLTDARSARTYIAATRWTTAVECQGRHPGIEVGERGIVELAVRALVVTILMRRQFRTITEGYQYGRNLSRDVAWQRGSLSCGARSSSLADPDQ